MGFDTAELQKLAADLGEASARVTPLASKVIRKTALDIEADAKALSPVDTGNLKNSISSDIGELTAEIGPTASYGQYLEYGTSKMHAQPYMGPAVDARTPSMEKALEQAGAKILD